jgi:hypothetical protein
MRKVLASCCVVGSCLAGFVAFAGACGGDKGDSCSDEGEVIGECDDGFVCGRKNNDQTGELVCLTRCDTQLNCLASEDCYGVAGTSLKGCRPK